MYMYWSSVDTLISITFFNLAIIHTDPQIIYYTGHDYMTRFFSLACRYNTIAYASRNTQKKTRSYKKISNACRRLGLLTKERIVTGCFITI